jgi:hypothetical protein
MLSKQSQDFTNVYIGSLGHCSTLNPFFFFLTKVLKRHYTLLPSNLLKECIACLSVSGLVSQSLRIFLYFAPAIQSIQLPPALSSTPISFFVNAHLPQQQLLPPSSMPNFTYLDNNFEFTGFLRGAEPENNIAIRATAKNVITVDRDHSPISWPSSWTKI